MSRIPSSLALAMDIGSSSLRTALFTERGVRIVPSTASQKYAVAYTADGGAELDPVVLLRAAKRCLASTLKAPRGPIIAVAGSAFWHSLLALDRKGRPLSPIFTWADSRSTADAAQLRGELAERRIQLRTGCMLRAPYWPAKLRWLRRTNPRLFNRTAAWVSPARWLFGEIFGVDLTSHSMASGTGLYNLRTGAWDSELCDLCGVRAEQLGSIADSSPAGGRVSLMLQKATIFAALGDGAASNLGSGADGPGRVAINIGTSAAVREIRPNLQQRGEQLPRGLFKHVVDESHLVVGGAMSNGGNLHRWSLHELRITEAEAETALPRVAASQDPLTVLPFWVSERAPTWPEGLHGTILGLTSTTSAADISRATTTSTFYRLAEILDLLRSSASPVQEVIISGGVLHSPASLRILADALGCDIRICRELESSLRGAAVYALRHLGQSPDPLRPGRVVRHRPELAEAHRLRRRAQTDLERVLAG